MSRTTLAVEWGQGAPPEAMVEAFAEAALTVAVLAALFEDPKLRERAGAVMRTENLSSPVAKTE